MSCGKNIYTKLAWGEGIAATDRDAKAAARVDFDQDKANLVKELKDWAKGFACPWHCPRKINGGIHEDSLQTSSRGTIRNGADLRVYDIKQGLRAEVFCERVPLKKTKGKLKPKRKAGLRKKKPLKKSESKREKRSTKKTKSRKG
jgi:hypothetical protein